MSTPTEARTPSTRGRTVLAIAGTLLLVLLSVGIGLSVASLRSGGAADMAKPSAGSKGTPGGGTSTIVGRNDEPVHVAPMRLSFTAKPGQKIAFAAIELRNASHRRGVIEDVIPSRISDGLDVVHIGATDTDNLVGKVVGAQPYDDLYHPEMWLESASGAVFAGSRKDRDPGRLRGRSAAARPLHDGRRHDPLPRRRRGALDRRSGSYLSLHCCCG